MALGVASFAWLLAATSGLLAEPAVVHDPAAVHARVDVPRTADLRNPFVLSTPRSAGKDRVADLKDPFAPRPTGTVVVDVQRPADLKDPFAAPGPACTTSAGVPVQRPRAVRDARPPCPPPAAATNRT